MLRTTVKKIISPCLLACTLLLAGCTVPPPNNIYDVCEIFTQYPHWYWATQETQKKWGVPVSVQMAIIYEESRFRQRAKPPREHILWFIPWFRPTSAYGYAQVINSTWNNYKRVTGNYHASRRNFRDITHFIGWYAKRAHRKLGIPLNNAFRLYLAYHEGLLGYRERTYHHKPWLVRIARSVQRRADRYHHQLLICSKHLPKKHWWNFW